MPSSIFITTPPSLSFSSSLLPFKTPPHFSPPHSTLPKPQNPHFTLTLTSQLATLPILSFAGAKVGDTALDLKTAPPATARAVVHRALITDLQNRRRGTASTLTRAEVSGGGRKPYPQKKTGRARRGSSRTPLRPGGGVVFGPKPRDWGIKINRKEKRLAISTAISSAAADAAAVVVVEEFGERFEERPRTREFIEAMRRWGVDPKEKSVFLMTEVSENVRLSSRNIGSLRMLTPRTLNLYDVLNADKLVLTPSAVDYLNERYGIDYVDDDDDDEDGDGEFEDGVEGDEGTEGEESADVVE